MTPHDPRAVLGDRPFSTWTVETEYDRARMESWRRRRGGRKPAGAVDSEEP